MIDEEKYEGRIGQPKDSNQKPLRLPVAILVCWMALLLLIAPFLGINWFNPGDLSYREAMYYHGIGISAWMVLVPSLANLRLPPTARNILASWVTISAAVLGGLGMYLWTFYLNPTLMGACYFVAVLSLLSSIPLHAL